MGPIETRVEELLLFQDEKGLAPSHYEIMTTVRKEFPHKKVSYNAVRWYKTKLQERGVKVPRQRRSPRQVKITSLE